jgi:hypothetical protein
MQGKLFEAFQYESIAITMPRALYKEPIKEFQDTKPLMNKKWRHDRTLLFIFFIFLIATQVVNNNLGWVQTMVE